VCGAGLVAKTKEPHRPGVYVCPKSHVQRSRHLVEMLVIEEAVTALAQPGFAAAFLPPENSDRALLEARIDTLEAEMDGYAVERRQGLITPRQMHKMNEDATKELAELRASLSVLRVAARVPAVLAGLAGNPQAAAVWDELTDDLDRRRAIIDALMVVTVNRAAHRGARWDPETIDITWKLGGPAV
jgi:hypothetical protein